jgi:hypothetical protein
MDDDPQGLAVGGHDGSFLVVDRVARSDCVVAIRGPDGEVLSAYLTNVDIEKLVAFLGQKVDFTITPASPRLEISISTSARVMTKTALPRPP